MGQRELVIHYCQAIPWQAKRIGQFVDGLARLGFSVSTTESQQRVSSAPAILFGTSFFQDIESSPGEWLLVDRASYGDPDFVRLGWNGRGSNANHKVPADYGPGRFASHNIELKSWKKGKRIVLCGDYQKIPPQKDATHFKPHPQSPENPTGLPLVRNFDNCGKAIVGASSVVFDCLRNGIRVDTTPDSLAYGWDDRQKLFEWVAWTQWTWAEIEQGEPIRHLF